MRLTADKLLEFCQKAKIDSFKLLGVVLIRVPFDDELKTPLFVNFSFKGDHLEVFAPNPELGHYCSRERLCEICNEWNANNIAPRAFYFKEDMVVGNIVYYTTQEVTEEYVVENMIKYPLATFRRFMIEMQKVVAREKGDD